jgi:hypothetical protein
MGLSRWESPRTFSNFPTIIVLRGLLTVHSIFLIGYFRENDIKIRRQKKKFGGAPWSSSGHQKGSDI